MPHLLDFEGIIGLHVLNQSLLFACDKLQDQLLLLLKPLQVVMHLLGGRITQSKAACIPSAANYLTELQTI